MTLAEAKAQLRLNATADDALVTGLIVASRQWAEQYTGRIFINQSWRLWIDAARGFAQNWWDGVREAPVTVLNVDAAILLPKPPLVSVTCVQYYDDSDTGSLWPATNYYVDTAREPGRLVLRTGAIWPTPTRLVNGISVDYVAGYGADASCVPEAIKLAIKQLIAHWYEHRGEELLSGTTRGEQSSRYTSVNVPLVIQALLNPYRIEPMSAL